MIYVVFLSTMTVKISRVVYWDACFFSSLFESLGNDTPLFSRNNGNRSWLKMYPLRTPPPKKRVSIPTFTLLVKFLENFFHHHLPSFET